MCCIASNRDQTLGLRSVVPSTSSSDSFHLAWSHPIMPRCEACVSLAKTEYRERYFLANRGSSNRTSLLFRDQLRVPAETGGCKPKTVDILCTNEEIDPACLWLQPLSAASHPPQTANRISMIRRARSSGRLYCCGSEANPSSAYRLSSWATLKAKLDVVRSMRGSPSVPAPLA